MSSPRSKKSRATVHRILRKVVNDDLDNSYLPASDSATSIDDICPVSKALVTSPKRKDTCSVEIDKIASNPCDLPESSNTNLIASQCYLDSHNVDTDNLSHQCSSFNQKSSEEGTDSSCGVVSDVGLSNISCNSDCSQCYGDDLPPDPMPVNRSELEFQDTSESELLHRLREWSVTHNITDTATQSLLKVLKPYHPILPKDPRTLKKRDKKLCGRTETMGSGEYYFFGLTDTLLKFLCSHPGVLELVLSFNIDGLPIFNSSPTEFWPILCLVVNLDLPPFVCAVWCGSGKPPLASFLKDFLPELNNLLERGLEVDSKHYKIRVKCFVCDAPAKSFIKGTVGHTGYYGCDKCTQKGKWEGRMTFPDCQASLRTHDSFINMDQKEHHKVKSPLTELPIDMISSFPLDYLHLICLGVVRRVLMWLLGLISVNDSRDQSRKYQRPRKKLLSDSDKAHINTRISSASLFWPRDFSRKPRSLDQIKRWKATEFRQFILYLFVVLKSVIPPKFYDHLCMLHVAITILCRQDLYQTEVETANVLLNQFVEESILLYGKTFVVYNVHNLVHLANDVKEHGQLDEFSAFPFENELYVLKHMIRGKFKPLQELINKVNERKFLEPVSRKMSRSDGVAGKSTSGPYLGLQGSSFSKFNCKGRTISLLQGDNAVVLRNSWVVFAKSFVRTESETYIIGKRFLVYEDLYTYPIDSSDIGIFRVQKLSKRVNKWPVSQIRNKVVAFPCKENDYFYVFPLCN